MYYQVVFIFDDDDNTPRYSIRPKVNEGEAEDKTRVIIDPVIAKCNEIALDSHNFPTPATIESWHRKHNPHLFID